jgi:hypothetical protein
MKLKDGACNPRPLELELYSTFALMPQLYPLHLIFTLSGHALYFSEAFMPRRGKG